VKTQVQIETMIKEIEESYQHVLTGSRATVQVNAPRALLQASAEAELVALHWTLGTKYESKLKGVNT